MAIKALPSPEVLRQLLTYDPETGKLFWNVRSPEHFSDGVQKTAAQLCKEWNSKLAGKEAFKRFRQGYPAGRVFGINIAAHRVAFALFFGYWPTGIVDHINGQITDNRICNLREVTKSLNAKNSKRSARNKSGVTGVFKQKNSWVAAICSDNKRMQIGQFKNFEDAVWARKAAEAKYGFSERHGS